MAGALAPFWITSGALSEGRTLLEQALSSSEATSRSSARAKACMELGRLLCVQGNFDLAEPYLQESLALARPLHFLKCIVVSLNWLGYIAMTRGNHIQARTLIEESLVLARQGGNAGDIAFALDALSTVLSDQGEYAPAARLAEESLFYYEQTGNRGKIADALWLLGALNFYQGELSVAASFHEASLVGYQEVGNKVGVSYALSGSGAVAVFQEDYASARLFLEASLHLHQENGDQRGYASDLHMLGRVACGEGNLAEAYARYQQSLTIFREIGYPTSVAFCLEGLAEVVVAQELPLQAAWILGYTEALRQTLHTIMPPVAQKSYQATVSILNLQLGESAFQEAWQQGQHREPEAVLQLLASNGAGNVSPSARLSTPTIAMSPDPDAALPMPESLTRREVEIFRLLASGLTKSQIAEQLTISFHTVSAHVRSIYAKVGVSSRSAATRYAIEHDLM
jgi:ATP/maltotriose-dependent transcriptional regulator MalT